MDITISPLSPERIDDLGRLFGTYEVTDGCWCMWFIMPVKEYHAAGGEGNRASITQLVAESELPMGLLAYNDAGEAVGWCAVGPRARYVRALKTPTYRGGEVEDDTNVWLVPCFFTRKDARGEGVTNALSRPRSIWRLKMAPVRSRDFRTRDPGGVRGTIFRSASSRFSHHVAST